jgi:ABC-type enterobactin transport system permease subunit
MNAPCVRSWHQALRLCLDLTNGFGQCPALPQPLTAAAVLSHNVVQFQTGTAPALIVSIALRRKPTLLRGLSSVETQTCIYSRLVHGASKGPNTAGSRCIISSTGAAVSRAALSTFELDRNPTSRRSWPTLLRT